MSSWLARILGRGARNTAQRGRQAPPPPVQRTLELEFSCPQGLLASAKYPAKECLSLLCEKMQDFAPAMCPGIMSDWGCVLAARYDLQPPRVRLTLEIDSSYEESLRGLYSEEWDRLCGLIANM